MTELTYLRSQRSNLLRRLEGADKDSPSAFLMQMQMDELDSLIAEEVGKGGMIHTDPLPGARSAIFMSGGGVPGGVGILPALASTAMQAYEDMFVGFALIGELLEAQKRGNQRRPNGSLRPRILLTGTPRGSFGMEFASPAVEDDAVAEAHAVAMDKVAFTALAIAESTEGEFVDMAMSMPKDVRRGAARLFKSLAKYQTEIRFAFPDKESVTIDYQRVAQTAERFERRVRSRLATSGA